MKSLATLYTTVPLLAAKDTIGAPSLDTAIPEFPVEEAKNAVTLLPKAEEDFSQALDELYTSAA